MKISRRDWAQLSAYLDGELSQRDIKKLEKRIIENPDFQAALEDLRTVRTALSYTPRLSVPRNFTLKQSMMEHSPQRVPTPGYRLAAVLLTILFLGVVVVDVGSGFLQGAPAAALPSRAEEVMLESAAEEMDESAWAVEVEAVEEGPTQTPEIEMAPVAPEQLEAVGEGDPEGMEDSQTKSASEEADRTADAGDEVYSEEPQELPNALTEVEDILSEEDQFPPSLDNERAINRLQIPLLRVLEITLGLGAIGFAVAAWVIRRKKR